MGDQELVPCGKRALSVWHTQGIIDSYPRLFARTAVPHLPPTRLTRFAGRHCDDRCGREWKQWIEQDRRIQKQRADYLCDPKLPIGSTEIERCILRERERDRAVTRGQLPLRHGTPASTKEETPKLSQTPELGVVEGRDQPWQMRRLKSDRTGFGFSGGAQSPSYLMTGTLQGEDKQWIERFYPNEAKSTMLLDRQNGSTLEKEANERLTDPDAIRERDEKEQRLQAQLLGRTAAQPALLQNVEMKPWSTLQPSGVVTQDRIKAVMDRKPVLLSPVPHRPIAIERPQERCKTPPKLFGQYHPSPFNTGMVWPARHPVSRTKYNTMPLPRKHDEHSDRLGRNARVEHAEHMESHNISRGYWQQPTK